MEPLNILLGLMILAFVVSYIAINSLTRRVKKHQVALEGLTELVNKWVKRIDAAIGKNK